MLTQKNAVIYVHTLSVSQHEPQELVSRASDLTTRVNALVRIVQAMEIDGAAAESYGLLLATVCAGSTTLAAEARKVAGGLDDAGLGFELQNSVMVSITIHVHLFLCFPCIKLPLLECILIQSYEITCNHGHTCPFTWLVASFHG